MAPPDAWHTRLATLALRDDNRVSWLGLTLVRERDWVIQPVGSDLYGGTPASRSSLRTTTMSSGDEESHTLARAVVDQLVRRLQATLDSLEPVPRSPPARSGAFGALGGAIYSLSHLGALWAITRCSTSPIALATR